MVSGEKHLVFFHQIPRQIPRLHNRPALCSRRVFPPIALFPLSLLYHFPFHPCAGVQLCIKFSLMNYEWDPNKARSNYKKHSVRFADAVGVFENEEGI